MSRKSVIEILASDGLRIRPRTGAITDYRCQMSDFKIPNL